MRRWGRVFVAVLAAVALIGVAAAKKRPSAGPLGSEEHWTEGETSELLAEVGTALEQLEPDDSRTVARAGTVLLRAGNTAEAEKLFARAESLDDDDDETILIIGLAYREAKMWDKADEAFAKATAMGPKDMDHVIEWGVSYWNRGDKAKAAELFAKAFTAEPDTKRLYFKLGRSLE